MHDVYLGRRGESCVIHSTLCMRIVNYYLQEDESLDVQILCLDQLESLIFLKWTVIWSVNVNYD